MPKKIRKNNRPNGLSLNRYKGHEDWSDRRWAWEFLRRDEEFIRACANVDSKERTEEDVATEFHLSQFKHCNMGFKSDKSPSPRFTVDTVKYWAILKSNEPKVSKTQIKPDLRPGQILIRFDLNNEFIVRGSLDAQLRVATRTLKKCLTTYSKDIKRKLAPPRKPERKSFLELLRRLDAAAEHDIGVQGLAALQPEEFCDLEATERSKKAASLMRTPREYAKEVYLTLAIRSSA